MRRGLLIGRFQPFHIGHLKAIEQAASENDEVIVGIGSAQYSYTLDNPFTAGERIEMIRIGLRSAGFDLGRFVPVPIPDVGEHHLWMSRVRATVPRFDVLYTNNPFVRLLAEAAGVKVREPVLVEREHLNGTGIRALMISGGDWRRYVQPEVAAYLDEIRAEERLRIIAAQLPTSERQVRGGQAVGQGS
ncbi:MAG: nicotinamide-nucleotide adenylyltransferase [Nitrososphaerota archaeon]